MGYEIMYKKVFLKATDEMGVDLYTPVCLIGPNNRCGKIVVGGYMARIFGAGWIPAWLLLLPSRIC